MSSFFNILFLTFVVQELDRVRSDKDASEASAQQLRSMVEDLRNQLLHAQELGHDDSMEKVMLQEHIAPDVYALHPLLLVCLL